MLAQNIGLPFSAVDPVFSDDAIDILQRGWTPIQEDVGGVESIASGVQWMTARGCRICH